MSEREQPTRDDELEAALGAQFGAVFGNSSDPVLLVGGENWLVHECNRPASDLVGVSGPLDSTPLPQRFADPEAVERLLEVALERAGLPTRETRTLAASGTDLGLEATALQGSRRRVLLRIDRTPTAVDSDDEPTAWTRSLAALGREVGKREDVAEIGRAALSWLERVTPVEIACLRTYDSTTDDLDPVVLTDTARRVREESMAVDFDRTRAGRAFRRQETVRTDPETDLGGVGGHPVIHCPLNDHGVLTACPPDRDALPATVAKCRALSAVVTGALDRVAAERTVADRERTLRDHRDRMEQVGSVVSAVATTLRSAPDCRTAEAVYRSVCRELVDAGLCERAWVGTIDPGSGDIRIEADAGMDDRQEDLLQQVPPASIADGAVLDLLDGTGSETEPEPEVRTGAASPHGETTRDGGVTAAGVTASVPVRYDGATRAVLVVAGMESEPGEPLADALETLGVAVGTAIANVRNTELLLGDETVELEFRVTDPGCMSVGLTGALNCSCSIEHALLDGENNHVCYLHVEGATATAARAELETFPDVEECRIVSDDTGDECVLEVVKSESGAEALMDVGATVASATAEDGVGTLVVEASPSVDVETVVERYRQINPESELVAKRTRAGSPRFERELLAEMTDELTQKQRDALETAFTAGYYDWPRGSTAEEVAASLDISSSTLHQHLRRAEHKLFSCLFDG